MEELQKLYDVLVREGKYTKSFEEFQSKWSQDEAYKNKVYDVVSRDGLYTKDKESFFQKYSAKAPVQSTTQETPIPLKKKFALDSSSEAGSLVSQESVKPQQQVAPQVYGEPPAKPMQKLTKKDWGLEKMAEEKELPAWGQDIIKKQEEGIKKLKVSKALFKNANKNALKTESSLQDAYKKDPISPIFTVQPLIGTDGKPILQETKLEDIVGVPSKEKVEEEYKKLDLDNPKPYLSASTYNREPVDNVPINKDSFIEETFTDEKLIKLGIDPADFDGYLNLSGFKEDYKKRRDRGDFNPNLWSDSNKKLNEELYKSKLLSNYIETKNNREVLKSKLNSVIASYDGKKIPVNKNAKAFDNNLIAKYTEENLPILYQKLKERDRLNKEKYQELTQDNTGLNSFAIGTKNLLKSGLNGFMDAVNKTSTTLYDVLGAEDIAEDLRYLNEERQLERPSERQVSFASGKVVDFNGKKYLVDEKGTVYDKDNEIVVNDLIEENSLNKILEEAKKSKKEDWFFSPQGTAVQTSSVLGDMIWQVAYQATLGRVVKGYGNLPIPKTTADAIIAQSSLGYSQGYETALKEAREAGLTDKESEEIAADAAQRTAIWYGMTAPISPQTKAVESLFGSAEKELIKKAVSAYKTNGKKGFISTLNNGFKNIPKKAVGFIEEGGKEVIQENIQQAGESLWINAQKNIEAGKEISNETMSFDDFVNTSALSFLSGGIVSNLKIPSFSSNNKTQIKNLYQLSQNMDVLDANLKEMIGNKIISQEDADNVKKDVVAVSRNITRIPKDTNPDVQLDIMRKLNDIEDLENSKETLDKSFHSQIDDKIKEKRNEINEIYNKSLTKISEQPIAEYIIDNNKYTKEEFFNQLQGKTQDELKAMNIVVNNDEQTATEIGKLFNIKTEEDAIQKQAAGQVPVQPTTRVGETMEKGKPQAEPEVTTEEGVKEKVTQTIIKPKVVITGTRNGMENLESSNYDQKTDTKIKDARGREQEFGENNVLVEDDGKGNKIINVKADAIDSFGRAGFLQASVIVPADTDVDVDAVKQVVDSEVNRIKEKNNETLRLNEVDPRDLSLMRDAIVNAVKPAPTTEVAPTAPVSNIEDDIENISKILEGKDVSNISNLIDIPQTIETSELDKIPRGETFQERLAPEYFDKLKKDIEENGIKEPIILQYYVKDNAMRLKEGHHRLKIAKELGIEEIPVKVNVIWNKNITQGNEDIQGKSIVSPPTAINKEKYIKRFYEPSNINIEELGYKNKNISEAYKKAKEDGSNPELVQAIETLLAPTTEVAPTATVSDTRAEIERRRGEFPDSQANTRTPITQKLLDYFAETLGIPKFTEDLSKGTYVSWLQNANPIGYAVAEKLNAPKQAFDIIAKYGAELAASEGAKPTTKATPTAPITELLNLDTKDKTNLQKISDFLDSLDNSLNIDSNELNDVTRVMAIGTAKAIIKTLKALVKTGITLQQAINRASEIHSVSSEDVIKAFDVIKNITTTIEDVKQELNERDLRKRFGLKEKSAPSVGRILGTIKDIKKITMTEKAALAKQIRDLARGAKDAVKAQKEITQNLSKEIKELASTGKITAKQAANIVRAFSKVDVFNQDSIDKFTDYMAKVFEKAEQTQQEEQKKELLSKMLKLVSKKAKTSITQTGKRRSAGLDAQGQSFFVAVKEVLKAFSKNDQTLIDKLNEQLSDEIAIDEAINKELRGEELTTKENMLLNRALAFDMFSDITNKSYEEIKSLYDGLVEARALSIQNLKQKRLDRAAQADTLKNQADNQIKKDFGILFNEDGSVKGTNQLRQEEEKIYQNFRELKIWSAIKEFVKRIDFTTITGIKDYFRSRLAHIGTLTNILDKSGTFFTDNVYRLLNQMEEKYLKGYYNQMNKLDEIASSIDGIKSYKDITKKLYTGVKKITINGKENFFNADQLLRIYALSKNNIQNNKLNAMGIDKNVLNKIEQMLDPSVIKFADKIVDYLSTEYFESVNKIYSNLNDVNLGFVENYFPTKTIQKKTESRLLEDGDFNGIFNAETAPALKERTDVGGEIDLSPAFTDVLDNHFQTIEKYKAYAEGVRKLNQLFSIESVNTLIEEIGIKPLLKRSINFAINPTAGLKEKQSFISKAMNKFTSFALSFKIWQIPKQATSFINAYEDYQFLKNKKTPGLDLLMFMVDSAYVIATLPKQIEIAYDMSASFKERLNKGIVGDSYVMESGTRLFRPVDKSYSIIARLRRGFKLAGAAFTIIGDIIGVMGYMVNHRRNMINKMDPELALEKFNDYNATAQTRRGSEKIALQQSQNDLTRVFTMFGSTTFLMMNKVAIAQTNIMRSLKKGEVPNQKDIRSLVLMLGLSNAMFVLVSNIGKFIYGDDDDKEEVKKSMFEALIGLDLLFSVPIIGAGLETAYRKAMGEKTRTSQGVNPYIQVFRKVEKAMESSDIVNSVRPFIELVLGAQLDPAIGLYNYFKSDDDPEAIYDILGISQSYRPKTESEIITSQKRKQEKEQVDGEMEERVEFIQKMIDEAYSPQQVKSAEAMLDRVKNPEMYKEEKEELKAMKERLLVDEETGTVYENLTDLKRYNPELYEKNFGEGSEYYELSKPQKELDKLFREEERAAKDKEFGYVPKNKKRKNSDGTLKKYSSMLKSYSGKGYKSKSNSKYEYYDSRGVKTTITRSREKN